jgi:hypothetical protein
MATPSTASRRPPRSSAPGYIFEPRTFSRRSRQRFARSRSAALIRHLGRDPSYPERILISRIVQVEWDLRRTDSKLDRGIELSGHDIRGRLAAENRLRLDLQALGLQPSVPAAPSLSDVLAGIVARRVQPEPEGDEEAVA